MKSTLVITRLESPDGGMAKASVTMSDGKVFSWEGRLVDSAYKGCEVPDGTHVVGSNSDGLFAWSILAIENS